MKRVNKKTLPALCLLIVVAFIGLPLMVSAMMQSLVNVPAGADLQAAINSAQPGDTLQLANAIYTCNCVDNKGLTILGPAVIKTPNSQPTLYYPPKTPPATLRNLTITTTSGQVYDIIRYGTKGLEQDVIDEQPQGLTIDNCDITGQPGQEVQRGIAVNGRNFTLINSKVREIHGKGYDTQAVAGWNGSGPFKIIGNYLEAAGENVMFGGVDPSIPNLIPSDIELRRNYLFKPLAWKGVWTVKNLLELKNARNVVIDGNVLENNWTDGQTGIAILFTVRNQECTAPWSTVQNVTFSNNTVKNAEGGLNFLGKDNEAEPAYGKCGGAGQMYGSVRGTGVTVSNNLFQNIRGPLITLNGFYNVAFTNNTSQQSNNLMTLYGEPSTGFSFNKHLTNDHDYGIFGDGGTVGTAALERWTPGFAMDGCVIATPYGSYPPGNQYPAIAITLPADWRSPYLGVGCDVDALLAAQGGTLTPTPSPTPSPTPTPTPSPTPIPARQVLDTRWPSSEAERSATWTKLVNEGWVDCVIGNNKIRCWRPQQ